MWPFMVIIGIIFLLNFRFGGCISPKKRFWIAIIILFLFAACRSNDSDYSAYLTRGEDIHSFHDVFDNNTHMEPGYGFIALIVNTFHLPAQMIIMLMALISLICTYFTIRMWSSRWMLSLLVYLQMFFSFDMQTARDGVAISISTLCITFLMKKNYIGFFVALTAACLFHNAALICLLLLPLSKIQINKNMGLAILMMEMAFVTFFSIDGMVLRFFRLFGLSSYYLRYFNYLGGRYVYTFQLWDIRLWLMVGLFFVTKWIFTNPTKLENLISNCMLASAALLIFFHEHTIFAIRISAFFITYQTIAIPLIIDRVLNAEKRITENGKVIGGSRILSIGKNRRAFLLFVTFSYTILAVVYALKSRPYSVFFIQ